MRSRRNEGTGARGKQRDQPVCRNQRQTHLAGVAYLPEIDWYEITLLDLDVLVPMSSFSGILLVYG
jgi:hypothetical protein